MSMIRGKLEASREISPDFVVIGETGFSRHDHEWVISADTETKAVVTDFEDVFYSSNDRHTGEDRIPDKL